MVSVEVATLVLTSVTVTVAVSVPSDKVSSCAAERVAVALPSAIAPRVAVTVVVPSETVTTTDA